MNFETVFSGPFGKKRKSQSSEAGNDFVEWSNNDRQRSTTSPLHAVRGADTERQRLTLRKSKASLYHKPSKSRLTGSDEDEMRSFKCGYASPQPGLSRSRTMIDNKITSRKDQQYEDDYILLPTPKYNIEATITRLDFEPGPSRESRLSFVNDHRVQTLNQAQRYGKINLKPKSPKRTIRLDMELEPYRESRMQFVNDQRVQNSNPTLRLSTRHAGWDYAKSIYLQWNNRPVQWISGLVVMPGQTLVAVAEDSVNIIPINELDGRNTQLTPSRSLHDVAQVTSRIVAVTSYINQLIYFIDTTRTANVRELISHGQCRGIARIDSDLVVTYDRPIKVEIINWQGRVKRVIVSEREGRHLFTWPWHVAVSPDQTIIYISDPSENKVTSLSKSGTVLATYRDDYLLRGPRGLAVDKVGHVYVCGFNSNNIVQLTASLAKAQVLFQDHTRKFWSICYCQPTDTIYIGMDSNEVRCIRC